MATTRDIIWLEDLLWSTAGRLKLRRVRVSPTISDFLSELPDLQVQSLVFQIDSLPPLRTTPATTLDPPIEVADVEVRRKPFNEPVERGHSGNPLELPFEVADVEARQKALKESIEHGQSATPARRGTAEPAWR